MNEEEIKRLWQEQGSSVSFAPGLLQEMEREGAKLKKSIKTRDRLEELAALLVGVFFLRVLFVDENLFVKIGCVLLIFFAIEAVVVLRLNRKEPSTEGFPLKEQIQQEMAFFVKQRLLLQNVTYWYIAPCFVGLTFFAYGVNEYWWTFALHTAFNILISGFIYWQNRKGVKEKFDPVIKDLQLFLHSLESDANKQGDKGL